jgi:hypothetical protein
MKQQQDKLNCSMVESAVQTDEEVTRVLNYRTPDRYQHTTSPSPLRDRVPPIHDRFTPAIKSLSTGRSSSKPPPRSPRLHQKLPSASTDLTPRYTPLRNPKQFTAVAAEGALKARDGGNPQPSVRNRKPEESYIGEMACQFRSTSPNAKQLLKLPKLHLRPLPTSILQKRIDHHYRNVRLSESVKCAKN